MKVCPNCQTNNEDGTNFCIKCGTVLKIPQSAPVSRKPSSGKKPFFIVAALVVVIYAMYAIIMASNPSLRLLSGMAKLGKTGAATVNSTITVKYRGDNDDLKLLNNASVKMSTAVDMNKMLAESSFDLLYDNKSVAKLSAGLGSEDLYLDPLKLYTKKFFYELDDQTLSIIDELQVLIKYIKQANIKFDSKRYAAIEKEILDDNLKGSLGKVTLTLDTKFSYEMLIAIFEEAADDEQLMESIRKNAQDIINKIQKDDHTFEVIFDEEYLQDALDYIEDKDDFADAYQVAVENAIIALEGQLASIKEYPENYTNVPEMEFTFKFGLFQSIKSISCSMNVDNEDTDESFKVVIDSSVKGGAHFTNFKRSGAVDVLDVVSDPAQAESIANKALKNVIINIKSNKKLTSALEDLTGQDIDDLDDYLVESLFGSY